MRDCWDKATIIAKVSTAIVVPLAIAFVPLCYQHRQAVEAEKRLWVQIGIDILRDKNTEEGIRKWALQIVNANSYYQIKPDAAYKFLKGEWTIPERDVWGWSEYGSFPKHLIAPLTSPQTAPIPNHSPPAERTPQK